MNRKIIASILAAAILIPAMTDAKTTRRKLSIFSPNIPKSTVIAPSDGAVEFTYEYSYNVDSTGKPDGTRESDTMILQIASDGVSKFSSLTNIMADSVCMTTTPEQRVDAILEGKLKRGEMMCIFKNYPLAGRVTHTEQICQDWFRYDEEMPVMDWELTDSTKTILGYECAGAETDFRGRHWRVFYTPDIPLMEGPWKLHGLPGLIMEAKADGEEYTFGCIGIRTASPREITLYDVPYNNTDRRKYYDTRHRFDINPYGYFESSGGGTISVSDEDGNPVLDAFDATDIPYDYIERDWRDLK